MIDPHFLKAAGESYRDFVVTKVTPLPELNCLLRELTHLPTGAQVMHILNDDPENLFCLSFQTLPSSSNGAAHILEHTVLCGSRKFPVKDPFFSMGRRSLNTFMNALTGSDFTCYPAASQVEKDFYNLLDVYLDAVFHPELKRLSFLQEGHRYEFATPSDPKSPLEIKGIVFNEMKGSLASADSRLWHAMMAALMPDLPYAHNSGGDPHYIPQLTYAELIAFHETYYHPSRCLFFFYGNLPLKKHLDVLAEKALNNVPKVSHLPPIPRQKRFHAPVFKEMRYPVEKKEESGHRTIVALGWLTAPLLDQEEVLALTVLDAILMETDAALLKRVLLESKLCVSADAYMDTEMSEVPYLIVCKGCDPQQVDDLEKKIKDTLQAIVAKGIPSHLIDAAIHQLELSRLEITGDQAPFGLTLFMRSALTKQHGCTPENGLLIHSLFESLLKKAKDPRYLPSLIQKHLLGNPHCVRLVMHPDAHLTAEETRAEKEKLEQIKRSLSDKQIAEILLHTRELSEYQKKTEVQSLDCLPKVTLDDVTPLVRDFPLTHRKHGSFEVFHHDCFTNHMLYADLIFDLPPIKEEELSYVPLLTTLLSEIGSGTRSYDENLEYIQAHTGGIGASCALHLQAVKLFPLMCDTLLSPRFNEKKRIEELLLQLREGMLNRLNRQAMRYASQLAVSGFSSSSHVSEAWHGLRYFKHIEAISTDLKNNLPKLIDQLSALKEQIISFAHPHLVLSGSKEMLSQLEKEHFYGLLDLPVKTLERTWTPDYPVNPTPSQARTIASQVAFNVEAYRTVSYIHPHAPALMVASLLLDNKVLHRRIREQGGAYGSGATYSVNAGNFYFHSYRDPHIASTLRTFQDSIAEIAMGRFSAQDLEEAKLGIIQQFDTPISPGSRALTAYGWLRDGKTKEMRQQFRNRLLALTVQEIQHAIETELLPQKGEGIVVSFAGRELLEKENALLEMEHRALPIYSI